MRLIAWEIGGVTLEQQLTAARHHNRRKPRVGTVARHVPTPGDGKIGRGFQLQHRTGAIALPVARDPVQVVKPMAAVFRFIPMRPVAFSGDKIGVGGDLGLYFGLRPSLYWQLPSCTRLGQAILPLILRAPPCIHCRPD